MIVLFHRDRIAQLIAEDDKELESIKTKLTGHDIDHYVINSSVLLSMDDHTIAVHNRIIKNTAPIRSARVTVDSL